MTTILIKSKHLQFEECNAEIKRNKLVVKDFLVSYKDKQEVLSASIPLKDKDVLFLAVTEDLKLVSYIPGDKTNEVLLSNVLIWTKEDGIINKYQVVK